MIPKYISQKIDRLNKILEEAYKLKIDIEKWAEKKGIDTSNTEWYDTAIDDSSMVCGISKEGIEEYLKDEEM